MARYGQIRDIYPKYDAVNIYIATNWYHAPVFGPRALEFALLLVYFGVLFIFSRTLSSTKKKKKKHFAHNFGFTNYFSFFTPDLA